MTEATLIATARAWAAAAEELDVARARVREVDTALHRELGYRFNGEAHEDGRAVLTMRAVALGDQRTAVTNEERARIALLDAARAIG